MCDPAVLSLPEPCVRLLQPELQLSQLSKAVGAEPEVWNWIASRSATTKHSYAARLLLALVIFEGYELFPAHDRGPQVPRVLPED